MSELAGFERVAVRAVSRETLPDRIAGLDGYRSALIVFLFRGQAIGRSVLPVRKGVVDGSDLGRVLASLAFPMWTALWAQPDPSGSPAAATVAVLANGNAAELEASLRSVVGWRRNHEILVVGGAGAVSLARDFQVRSKLIRQGSRVEARNAAFEAASEDVVAFLEAPARAGDNWLPGLLGRFADPLTTVALPTPFPLEIETMAQLWQEELYGYARSFEREAYDITNLDPLAAPDLYAGTGYAVRRDFLAASGGFHESEPDTAFLSRAIESGSRIVREPSALVWNVYGRTWKAAMEAAYEFGAGRSRWWSRSFVNGWNPGAPGLAARQARRCMNSMLRAILRRPGAVPLDLVRAEMRGTMAGALVRSRAGAAGARSASRAVETHPEMTPQ